MQFLWKTFFAAALIWFGAYSTATAQIADTMQQEATLSSVRVFVMLQTWANYSMGVWRDTSGQGDLVRADDRLNTFFRRARLGFKGAPTDNFQYTLVLFYDNLGKDALNSIRGNPNNEALFGVWDAFIQLNLLPKSDIMHLTAGYFRPQVSRENLTSAWEVNSFDKSISQLYVRQLLVERTHGRATGINIGGQENGEWLSFSYNLGIFNTSNTTLDPSISGNSAGYRWSPLWAGRVALSLGQPDMEKYSIAHEINFYSQRKGVTIAAYASRQGTSDLFDESVLVGTDLLLNYGALNFDAEWNFLRRAMGTTVAEAYTGHVRLGYNINFGSEVFIEPSFMATYFKRLDTSPETAFMPDGEEVVLDGGVNWYIDKTNVKLALHYVRQYGSGSRNFYTFAKGRSIRSGNYVGLGFQFIFR